jgi:acyl transferase domain-containing protein
VTDDLLTGQPIPIGKPLVHECAFIGDEDFHEAPVGHLGQLVIGGPGVALGYYNMPEKTAAAFIPDPRPGHSGTVYLTGDLAMIIEDGRFAFAGRADRQIKLGGRRIEMDGIEHVLRGCEGVHNAIVEVVVSSAGDRRVYAAIQPETDIPADQGLFVRNVLAQARQGLHPEFLRKVTLTVPDLPLTKMGKPDRKALRALLEVWQHILQGDDLIQRFDPSELENVVDPATRASPNYVPARSILKDVDQFDAKYFGILPREAQRMDPQARVFLEPCVQALDDAGLDPARASGPVGVFAGSSMSTYLLNNLMSCRGSLEKFKSGFQIDDYATLTGNVTVSLATRVAFKLNLKGPALTVHTACSTSLTAIAQAVTSQRAGQADVALAAGVSITFPQKRGYMTQEGGMSSTDGLCQPFDAKAGGTDFGHGAGVLVLKRLADAVAAGGHIEAVIRVVGLNNDGADKISFTAPSVNGQADAIRAAHKDAGVAPDSISYIECHGTATPLGDPIEIRALSQAFDSVPGKSQCALGSVKGNIGHLDAAAGGASVIKLARMLREGIIPPVAHFETPNPRIDFDSGPFFVPTDVMDWQSDGPRRAGVSGFGVGGTNVHLVLEEPPALSPVATAPEGTVQTLNLSAKSAESPKEMSLAPGHALQASGAPATLADLAYTLQEGRQIHPFRLAVAATTPQDAAAIPA